MKPNVDSFVISEHKVFDSILKRFTEGKYKFIYSNNDRFLYHYKYRFDYNKRIDVVVSFYGDHNILDVYLRVHNGFFRSTIFDETLLPIDLVRAIKADANYRIFSETKKFRNAATMKLIGILDEIEVD